MKSSSLNQQVEELDTIMMDKVHLSEDARVGDLEWSVYGHENESIIYANIYDNKRNRAYSLNYFGGDDPQGSIHSRTRRETTYDEYLTWGGLITVLKALDLDAIAKWNADSMKIMYSEVPLQALPFSLTKEDKERTFSYDHISEIPHTEGNMTEIGYYLYKNGTCVPLTTLSGLDGEYYIIGIYFSRKDKGKEGHYHGMGWLGVLLEKED